ncbi:MAG: hypothetical protein P4L83_23495 [Nevskia sp.]|nr:hypothetical protein [Nevskia sp.]
MQSTKTARDHGIPVTVVAVVMALAVNAALGAALARTPTAGQRYYSQWDDVGTLMADTSAGLHRNCVKG